MESLSPALGSKRARQSKASVLKKESLVLKYNYILETLGSRELVSFKSRRWSLPGRTPSRKETSLKNSLSKIARGPRITNRRSSTKKKTATAHRDSVAWIWSLLREATGRHRRSQRLTYRGCRRLRFRKDQVKRMVLQIQRMKERV